MGSSGIEESDTRDRQSLPHNIANESAQVESRTEKVLYPCIIAMLFALLACCKRAGGLSEDSDNRPVESEQGKRERLRDLTLRQATPYMGDGLSARRLYPSSQSLIHGQST